MTRDEAIAIRQAQLNGKPVKALELQEAVFTLSKRRDRRMVLPPLPAEDERLRDAALCFRLGLAMGGRP
jgi:hypothetical protein